MIATTLALRLSRWGIAGFGALAFVITYVQAQSFYQIAGHTAAERAAFGQSMSVLASQFTIILPPPIRPDTVGGYVQWRSYGGLAVLVAIWALASATGASRQDEERGLVEAVLASSLSRGGMIASRIVAFAIASFAASTASGLGLVLGMVGSGESISLLLTIEAGVALIALALSCYSLTLLVAQLTSARIATATAGLVLLVLFLVNTLSHTFTSFSAVRWLSPFRYYELSQPLAPGGNFDIRATLILFGSALVAGAWAALAFAHRDLGSSLFRWPARQHGASYVPSGLMLWRIPVARGLYDRRIGLIVWAAGMSALGPIFVALTKSIIQPLLSIPALAPYLGGFVHGPVYATFLGFMWFSTAELLFAAFAITQVARWSAEDTDGRLELILSNPVSRAVIVVERAVVLAIGGTLVAAVSGRWSDDVRRMVGLPGLVYVGSHGLETAADAERWRATLKSFIAEVDWPVEDKGLTASFHYRTAADQQGARAKLEEVAERAGAVGLRARFGRKVLELVPPIDADKGTAIRELMSRRGLTRALYAGDDTTDLDAFGALDGLELGVRVAVASKEGPVELRERADIIVDDPLGFLELLRRL
jgi:trehalose-phosphatase